MLQCRRNIVNDWAGKNIAEGRTSDWSLSCTFTYRDETLGRDETMRAVRLHYRDYEAMIKYMRVDRKDDPLFSVRHFSCGEYGSKKGRAHFHGILHGKGRPPEHEEGKNFHFKYWPWGFSWMEPCDQLSSARYVAKYLLKPSKDEAARSILRMSRHPPLGAEYFARLAGEYVNQGLAPQTARYSFPEIRRSFKKKGVIVSEPIEFTLRRQSLDLYCAAWLHLWGERYPGREIPESEVIQDYLDRVRPRFLGMYPASGKWPLGPLPGPPIRAVAPISRLLTEIAGDR